MRNLILITIIGLALTSWDQQQNDQNPGKAQSVLNEYKDSVTNFGMVALMDNGKNIDTASIGYAYDKHAISARNRFCIGSCTKMFTAVAILKLQEQGLLNINDSVYLYLPKHKFIDSTITIKQLLNHTSGIADFLNNGLMNASILDPQGDFSDKVLYAQIDTLDFEKGSRYRYCNTNYLLLAKIIEKVTDKSWEMNIQEMIINRLQLKNTFPYYSNTIERLAHPILEGTDFQQVPKKAINQISTGSGNIVSDVVDLNTFMRALLVDKTLLEKHSLDLMKTFFEYKNNKYGLGLIEEKHRNRILQGHTGRQLSYITYAFVDPKTGESFVVMNNNMNDEIIDKVFDKLCGN